MGRASRLSVGRFSLGPRISPRQAPAAASLLGNGLLERLPKRPSFRGHTVLDVLRSGRAKRRGGGMIRPRGCLLPWRIRAPHLLLPTTGWARPRRSPGPPAARSGRAPQGPPRPERAPPERARPEPPRPEPPRPEPPRPE